MREREKASRCLTSLELVKHDMLESYKINFSKLKLCLFPAGGWLNGSVFFSLTEGKLSQV